MLLAVAGTVPAVGHAQTPPASRPETPAVGPPIRRIATASALSTEQIGVVTSVLELRDGRVLVNDGTRRRLLLMDTTLATVQVVLDSLSEFANTYGTRPGTLLAISALSALVPRVLAVWWTAGLAFDLPHLSMTSTAATHGVANAVGYTLCGLLGWRQTLRQKATAPGTPESRPDRASRREAAAP